MCVIVLSKMSFFDAVNDIFTVSTGFTAMVSKLFLGNISTDANPCLRRPFHKVWKRGKGKNLFVKGSSP